MPEERVGWLIVIAEGDLVRGCLHELRRGPLSTRCQYEEKYITRGHQGPPDSQARQEE